MKPDQQPASFLIIGLIPMKKLPLITLVSMLTLRVAIGQSQGNPSIPDAARAAWVAEMTADEALLPSQPGTRNALWEQRALENISNAKKDATSIQVIFDGDSITDWWERADAGLPVWTEKIAPYHAVDFGIAGDKTQHLLWRLSKGQAEGLHPKVIFLMIGTNNLSQHWNAQQIADGVKAIVSAYRVRCPNAVIVLQAIFPRGPDRNDPARTKINEINRILSTFAKDPEVIYLDFGDKFLNTDGTLSREIMPDYLHPSAKGYQIWAQSIQTVLDKYLSLH